MCFVTRDRGERGDVAERAGAVTIGRVHLLAIDDSGSLLCVGYGFGRGILG